jgi:hypothetical protein
LVSTTAITALRTAFEETFPRVGHDPDADGAVVLTSWPSVPPELVRAAGLRPVVARGSTGATLSADRHLEADIFPSRIRHLVEAALTGRLSRVSRIVIPRTSDPDYKCFLYLREFERRGVVRDLAPTLLFDLLQSAGPAVRAYDVSRTRALFHALTAASGRRPSDEDLQLEIARSNAARAAARQIVALRHGLPRVTGTEVLPLLGAFWQMEPERYASLAGRVASEIARRPPLDGPRVLLAGAPVDGAGLHAAIERHGAVVVAEAGPWGSGAAGDDVNGDGEPIAALADKYRTGSVGPRTRGEAHRWMGRPLDGIDAVVVSLPPDDAVFGWDYPAVRVRLEAQHVPHVVLRGDPYAPLTTAEHARLDALVGAAAPLRQARHG